MNISGRHSNSNFAPSFDSHRVNNFAKNINMSEMVSVWCELLCELLIYTLKTDDNE